MNYKTFLAKQKELENEFESLKSKYLKGEISEDELRLRKKELQDKQNSNRKLYDNYKKKDNQKWYIISAVIGLFILYFVFSNKDTIPQKSQNPYDTLHIAFEGYPDKEQIKKLLEPVMQEHNFPVNDENILKAGNSLVLLHEKSAIGVTEMEILKHAYQNSIKGATLGEQFGFSATILEKTK